MLFLVAVPFMPVVYNESHCFQYTDEPWFLLTCISDVYHIHYMLLWRLVQWFLAVDTRSNCF